MVDGAKWTRSDEGPTTMDQIWEILRWSFRVLLGGVWPSRDWKGKPLDGWRWDKRGESLCGDSRLCIFQLAADLDYLCSNLGLQHFNDGDRPCFRCHGNRSTMLCTDIRPSAAWCRHVIDRGEWFSTPKHALFADVGIGLSLFHIQLDVLHMLDLGLLQHVCGSVIVLLVFYTALDGSFEHKSATVWSRLMDAYKELATPAGERLPDDVFAMIFERAGRSARPHRLPTTVVEGGHRTTLRSCPSPCCSRYAEVGARCYADRRGDGPFRPCFCNPRQPDMLL